MTNNLSGIARTSGNSRTHRLPQTVQAAFDLLIDKVGPTRAGLLLGVNSSSLDRLRHGGSASAALVAKITSALASFAYGGAR